MVLHAGVRGGRGGGWRAREDAPRQSAAGGPHGGGACAGGGGPRARGGPGAGAAGAALLRCAAPALLPLRLAHARLPGERPCLDSSKIL